MAELQFALLMRLDEIFTDRGLRSLRRPCIELVEEYLERGDRDTGLGVWKAADFLADHAPLSMSLAPLLRILTGVSRWRGRWHAVVAVPHAWDRASGAQRTLIVAALHQVAKSDRSARVRDAAQAQLVELRKMKRSR